MNNLVRLGESLEESISNEKLKDLIEDLGDLAFKQISGAGESLPVLSFLFKSIKAYNAVRDYFFSEKVVKYLTEIATIPYEERKKTMNRISSDAKHESVALIFIGYKDTAPLFNFFL